MGAIVRAPRRPGVVVDTGMCGRSLLGNREISWSASATCVERWSVSGGGEAVADSVGSREAGPRHSSCEADEQGRATGCGVGGAKGGGRGECESAKHGPGTVPGNRVTGAEAHTEFREHITTRRYTPEVGAVCPNWARTDLCGGREVTRVPPANVIAFVVSPAARWITGTVLSDGRRRGEVGLMIEEPNP